MWRQIQKAKRFRCVKAQQSCTKQPPPHTEHSNTKDTNRRWVLILKHNQINLACAHIVSPWFRYVSVSSCSLTAGDVAAHSTYWNGGFLVSCSGGRLVFSCLKIGRANTSLRDQRGQKTDKSTWRKHKNLHLELSLHRCVMQKPMSSLTSLMSLKVNPSFNFAIMFSPAILIRVEGVIYIFKDPYLAFSRQE